MYVRSDIGRNERPHHQRLALPLLRSFARQVRQTQTQTQQFSRVQYRAAFLSLFPKGNVQLSAILLPAVRTLAS